MLEAVPIPNFTDALDYLFKFMEARNQGKSPDEFDEEEKRQLQYSVDRVTILTLLESGFSHRQVRRKLGKPHRARLDLCDDGRIDIHLQWRRNRSPWRRLLLRRSPL